MWSLSFYVFDVCNPCVLWLFLVFILFYLFYWCSNLVLLCNTLGNLIVFKLCYINKVDWIWKTALTSFHSLIIKLFKNFKAVKSQSEAADPLLNVSCVMVSGDVFLANFSKVCFFDDLTCSEGKLHIDNSYRGWVTSSSKTVLSCYF